MLMLISPAKTLDYETALPTTDHTLPTLRSYSQTLIDECRKLTPSDIAHLMKVSDKIAGLNVARFSQWQPEFTFDNARQALFAFKGDVYTGLDAYTLSDDDLAYAQTHLRMLSGLYGVLKPLDLMQPYRLEMGCKFATKEASNLYQFWGSVITDEVNQALQAQGDDIVVNLASNEYFKSIQKPKLNGTLITPIFKDEKNGQFKVISFYAKKARGMMARYIIQNQVSSIEALKAFDIAGYEFVQAGSTKQELLFQRREQSH